MTQRLPKVFYLKLRIRTIIWLSLCFYTEKNAELTFIFLKSPLLEIIIWKTLCCFRRAAEHTTIMYNLSEIPNMSSGDARSHVTAFSQPLLENKWTHALLLITSSLPCFCCNNYHSKSARWKGSRAEPRGLPSSLLWSIYYEQLVELIFSYCLLDVFVKITGFGVLFIKNKPRLSDKQRAVPSLV